MLVIIRANKYVQREDGRRVRKLKKRKAKS